MGYSYFPLREEIFSSILDLKNPRTYLCTACNTTLELRNRRNDRNKKFWGCPSWPNCNTTADYLFEDKLAFIDYYNPNEKYSTGFSGAVFTLKYGRPDRTLIQKFSESLYNTIENRIGINEFDFFITIPDSQGNENPAIDKLRNNGPLGQIQYLSKAIAQIRGGSQKDAKTLERRIQNVQGKYQVQDRQSITGSKVLIIDDIVTSGSSVHEVSWIIREINQQASYAASIGKNRRI